MDTNALKKFAQAARNQLMEQVRGKLGLVLAGGSSARREAPQAVRQLEAAIANNGREQVVEQVAYTWFNRFTALRFMDVNGYTSVRAVSPADGQTRPELLAEALAGNVDDAVPSGTKAKVLALLDGRSPSGDPQGEAYRLLLVTTCNQWHEHMPFMFEKISDFTELLMPDDLLSQNSILAHTRKAMTQEACQDVEVIGWLYQFYISEKKDQVFAGLKKNQKITAENIPAATQLFTPHWIVRYLVENSLGRLWLLNRPGSKLVERMDYYIPPEEPEADFLRVKSPEEIKVCDPACGSAHMLTYAFDLLYQIYEEEGFDPVDIPALILEHNLTGIEIDDRAGALAAFALAMKAAERLGRRRFLRMQVKPNIVVLQNVIFTPAELQDVAAVVGRDFFTDALRETLLQFEQAKNFGSLIVPNLPDAAETLRVVEVRDFGSDLLLNELKARVLAALRMAEVLSADYSVLVANPPYSGGSGLNGELQQFAKRMYPKSRADLYAMFMERLLLLGSTYCYVAMVNMQSWMFLSTYDKLRASILEAAKICGMAHIGERGFDSIGGAVVSTTAFVLQKSGDPRQRGTFVSLTRGRNEEEKSNSLRNVAAGNSDEIHFAFRGSDFSLLPNSPIAFWISPDFVGIYAKNDGFAGDFCNPNQALVTGNTERYIRRWAEVSQHRCGRGISDRAAAKISEKRWFPYNKGGDYRNWYGNLDHIVDWESDGHRLQTTKHPTSDRIAAHNFVLDSIFKEAIVWSKINTGDPCFRMSPAGHLFDDASGVCTFSDGYGYFLLGLFRSRVNSAIQAVVNPTVNIQPANLREIPVRLHGQAAVAHGVSRLIDLAKVDWDAYETSWDFSQLPLLAHDNNLKTLSSSYMELRAHWRDMTEEMQRLEEENNRIFIDSYGLQDELKPDAPPSEVTLTCNPEYRYGGRGSVAEREARLLEDTVAEFLHYAVGCMFGRYSLDVPGLVLANQGERLEDYLAKVPSPTFMPDKDNVIPVLDGEWFADDVTERFRKFLQVTFGDENYRENLAFIEKALGKDIRKWFTRDFFDYHVRRFKKRPIYWLFSSPKGTFSALMYMHRYRPETVSVLLNDYLREHIRKLEIHRTSLEKHADDPSIPPSKATRARKDIITVSQQIDELKDWERDVIFPLAQQRIEIDLDDGVKANYPKFGAALRTIKGLEAADE